MKKVLVLVADGTEEVEVVTVVDYLRRAGVTVDLCSVMEGRKVLGAHDIYMGADITIDQVRIKDYDAIYSPGGMEGTYNIRDNEAVIKMYQEMNREGKIVSALCAAPLVLDKSGLLRDKDFTCYPGIENDIENGNHKDEIIVKDGNLITGRGPAIAALLAFQLIEELLGPEKRKEVEDDTLWTLLKENI